MTINKPLNVCVANGFENSMSSTLWASELTPNWSTSLPLQVR